jgi:hypothetical protein
MAKMDTFLGRCAIDVARLPANEKKTLKMTLRDTSTGSIVVICEYIPLFSDAHGHAHAPGAESVAGEDSCDEADVLYDALPDELGNSTLEGDDLQDHLLDEDQDPSGVWSWSAPQDTATTMTATDAVADLPESPARAAGGKAVQTPAGHSRLPSSMTTPRNSSASQQPPSSSSRSQHRPQQQSHSHQRGGAVGALQVSSIRLRNLKTRASTFFGGQASCFVRCSMNSIIKRTKAIQVSTACLLSAANGTLLLPKGTGGSTVPRVTFSLNNVPFGTKYLRILAPCRATRRRSTRSPSTSSASTPRASTSRYMARSLFVCTPLLRAIVGRLACASRSA